MMPMLSCYMTTAHALCRSFIEVIVYTYLNFVLQQITTYSTKVPPDNCRNTIRGSVDTTEIGVSVFL